MKLYKVLMACMLVAGMSTQAQATTDDVIDQLQDNFGPSYSNGLDNVYLAAQSFQQTSDNISGAGIFLSTVEALSGTGDVTIALWASLPSFGGTGTPITSGTATGTSGTGLGAGGWLDVFWNPVAVTLGTTYYLVIDSTDHSMGLTGTTANVYTSGNHFSAASGTYQDFGYDLTFRTYTSVVPVPTAIWLFGTGLIGLFGMRKKASLHSVESI